VETNVVYVTNVVYALTTVGGEVQAEYFANGFKVGALIAVGALAIRLLQKLKSNHIEG